MSAPKVKVLLVGTITAETAQDFVNKIASLQSSKAGPFDACFVCGTEGNSEDLFKKKNISELPLPTFVVESASSADETKLIESTATVSNLRILRGANVWSLDVANKTQLVVASCPAHVRMDSDLAKPLMEKVMHVSYVGCDLLLSTEWPQGVEQVLSTTTSSAGNDDDDLPVVTGSYDVAEIALRARPRYHVAPHTLHLQSLPFKHLAATSSTFTPKHVGRFLTLAPVVSPAQFKTFNNKKAHKFVHALGLTPLLQMSSQELDSLPPQLQPCPYTDESYEKDGGGSSKTTTNVGLSEAQARRLLSEANTTSSVGDSHMRWNTNKKRKIKDGGDDGEPQEADPTNTTLFLHGLHKDVRGTLQTASAALLLAFSKYQVEKVRRPPAASSYAFLDFPSHEAALKCLEETGGEVTVEGVHLTLKWANVNPNKNKDQENKKRRLTEAEAMDSSTLYFRLPSQTPAEEISDAAEDSRQLMERTLENALGDPDVTAKTEPALQVKMRQPDSEKNFGFLEFASHAAASMSIATLTGNTDGGLLTSETSTELPANSVPSRLLGLALHWAHDAKAEEKDSRGLKFQRKHFPEDSRTDCWFCLASPTCEKHLITSVHNECYIAMPKGPADPGHVLLIPVTHSSKGALVDRSIAEEMEGLKQTLRQHASDVWQKDVFVFERAIQTKGGYHTHVQCIPVDRGLGIKLQSTMMGMARSSGFDLRELSSDLALSAVVSSGDDEMDGGYFYAEVPFGPKESKRFLHKAKTPVEGERRQSVPLQFGREVLATVLDNPNLGHWKACVLDQDKETELADAFRESFAKYLPP